MKHILIIGSQGYIGSRLINDYSSCYSVNGIDIGWFGGGDNTDYNNLSKEELEKYDTIILLAGHSSVKMCDRDMNSAFNNNVRNFVNLLEKMNAKQKLIYASSSSVYGLAGANAVDETRTEFVPHNDYDITKYMIDLVSQRSSVECYGLRFGTVNGYSPNVRSDVMINAMTYSAMTEKEIKLYIKDIIRPILGINDLSRAIKEIIDCDEDKRGIYNLASFSDTAEGIAKSVSEVTGARVQHYETDPNNITNSKLQTKCYDFDIDCTKFKETFNFMFKDNAKNITEELVENFEKIDFSNRSTNIKYE
jgi:UDP-glucose 4-epimerase